MSFPDCPECGKRFSKRIHRSFVVKYLLPWRKVKRYYCSNCKRSFYVKST